MKRRIACILALLIALSGCAAGDVPQPEPAPVVTAPAESAPDTAPETPADEPEAPADALPESCRVYYDTAARCGGGAGRHARGGECVRWRESGLRRAAGAVSIERGRVEITGGTVYLAEGLWLGEGDVVVSGGEVIVPGGLDAICCGRGEVLVTGGVVREP